MALGLVPLSMATFFLRLLLVDAEDLVLAVKEEDSDRLRQILHDKGPEGFFWVDSLDGRSVIVNLAHLQGARFLWEVFRPIPSEKELPEDFQIKFRGKEVLAEAPSEHPTEVYSLFSELEMDGSETIHYEDCDGEIFCIVPREVVWISAPQGVLEEGKRELREEGDAP